MNNIILQYYVYSNVLVHEQYYIYSNLFVHEQYYIYSNVLVHEQCYIYSNVRGSYQKFCILTINFFIIHFTCHLSQQL